MFDYVVLFTYNIKSSLFEIKISIKPTRKENEMSGSMHDLFMFWSLLEQSSDSITIKQYDADGNGGYGEGYYARVSAVKARHHGLARAQMRNKTDFDFLSKEEAQQAREADIWVMNNGKQLDIAEQKIVRKGKVIWYNTTIVPWLNTDGVIYGTICIARDVTVRVEAQHRSKRLLRFLIKRMYLPMVGLAPLVKNLGSEHRVLAHSLKEMLVRTKRILSSID